MEEKGTRRTPTPYYQDEHVTLYHGDCLELADLLAEVERLRPRAALADAMIERVARDSAAKESFISRRPWEGLSHDERTYRRAQAHRILAADLGTEEEA